MQLSNRSLALDVFRGMTVCFMIIVNTPEVGVLPMHYCYTLIGMVYANRFGISFISFAVGNSMSFVMDKWRNMPASKS
jgi:predicted acyltransferase